MQNTKKVLEEKMEAHEKNLDVLKQEMEALKNYNDQPAASRPEEVYIPTENTRGNFKVRALSYDGKSSLGNYFRKFNAAALATGWNNRAALIILLRGDALDIHHSIPDERQDDFQLH